MSNVECYYAIQWAVRRFDKTTTLCCDRSSSDVDAETWTTVEAKTRKNKSVRPLGKQQTTGDAIEASTYGG